MTELHRPHSAGAPEESPIVTRETFESKGQHGTTKRLKLERDARITERKSFVTIGSFEPDKRKPLCPQELMTNLIGAIQKNRDSVLQDWMQGIQIAVRRRDLIDDR